MYKKKIIILAVLLAIIIAGYLYFIKSTEIKIEYQIAQVQKGDINITVTASGTLVALESVDIGTQVSGKIEKIFVDFNSRVEKGQVIAVLDRTPLNISVDDNKAALYRAEVLTNQADRDYKRPK